MKVTTRFGAAALAVVLAVPQSLAGQNGSTPPATYWVYVANESSDLVSRVRFGPDGAVEERTIEVGWHPADIEGAHGLSVAPAGDFWYVTMAHGQPYGALWKVEAGTERVVDTATVGLFPATIGMAPDGSMAFVVNFNLHGNPEPSSVSAVFTPFMSEVKKIRTCVQPHGSRLSHDGRFHYSTCVLGDQLVEISTSELAVTRRLALTDETLVGEEAAGRIVRDPGVCKPTWVVVAPNDERLYVPCNARGEVLELDAESLGILRRFPTGRGPYNADITPDGSKLVVTLKGNRAVAIIDLATGSETRVETSETLPHGVTIATDSRFAFVSNEAVGATRGTIDVIDLMAARLVASVAVQFQPGGIGFWKREPALPGSP